MGHTEPHATSALSHQERELQLEVALGTELWHRWKSRTTPAEPTEPKAPTEAELRQKAAEIGISLPLTRLQRIRTHARADTLPVFDLADDPRTQWRRSGSRTGLV